MVHDRLENLLFKKILSLKEKNLFFCLSRFSGWFRDFLVEQSSLSPIETGRYLWHLWIHFCWFSFCFYQEAVNTNRGFFLFFFFNKTEKIGNLIFFLACWLLEKGRHTTFILENSILNRMEKKIFESNVCKYYLLITIMSAWMQ